MNSSTMNDFDDLYIIKKYQVFSNGGEAYKKIDFIDLDKHNVIISSHPSGLSANKEFKSYPAFVNQDHFGLINSHLKEPIDWCLPNYYF